MKITFRCSQCMEVIEPDPDTGALHCPTGHLAGWVDASPGWTRLAEFFLFLAIGVLGGAIVAAMFCCGG